MGTVPGPDRESTIKHSKDGGNQRAPIATQNERQCGIAATIATNCIYTLAKTSSARVSLNEGGATALRQE